MNEYILWDVDTQNDFFDREFEYEGKWFKPALPVPESGDIRPNLAKLISNAKIMPGWRIMGSVDAHTEDDVRHIKKWGKHCMKETLGQTKIYETYPAHGAEYIPAEKIQKEELEEIIQRKTTPVYFEKHERPQDEDPDACNSVRVNANVEEALKIAKPKVIAVAGVVLGYCVKGAVDYFLDLGYKVALVTDAIKEFSPDELTLYADWKKRGAVLVHTRDVLQGKLEELVK